MMTVSLTHPHDPCVITRDCWDLYSDEAIEAPRVAPVPLEARDPHSRSLYYHYGQDKCAPTDADYRRARRGYYGMISYVDALFGRVMAALEDCGFSENTVVIFASDHGDMIGERGMWFKKTLFDPAIRVPLIVAHPAHGAMRISTPASLVDIMPTLIEIGGEPGIANRTPMDGRSLMPALRGEATGGPVMIEHIDGGTAAPRVCIRDGDMKLVLSRAYPPQLYDLAADPLELRNIAGTGHPEEARLTALAEETWSLDTLQDDVIASQTARKLVDAALATGREEVWDFTPRPQTHSNNYVRRGDAFPAVERRGYLPYRNERTPS